MVPSHPSMNPRIQTMNATESAIPPRVSPLRQRFLARFRKPIFAEIILISFFVESDRFAFQDGT
jgi:hypothetical protein